jgi:hypothetical protein
MVQGFETLQSALAQDGRFDLTRLADAIDDVSTPPAIAMLILFIPGAFFGLLTMTVALWCSEAVPRGPVLLIPAFIVVAFLLSMGRVGPTALHGRGRCDLRPRPPSKLDPVPGTQDAS